MCSHELVARTTWNVQLNAQPNLVEHRRKRKMSQRAVPRISTHALAKLATYGAPRGHTVPGPPDCAWKCLSPSTASNAALTWQCGRSSQRPSPCHKSVIACTEQALHHAMQLSWSFQPRGRPEF